MKHVILHILFECVYVSVTEGTTWSTDSSNRTSSWLVLRNLTPQVRPSCLKFLIVSTHHAVYCVSSQHVNVRN